MFMAKCRHQEAEKMLCLSGWACQKFPHPDLAVSFPMSHAVAPAHKHTVILILFAETEL